MDSLHYLLYVDALVQKLLRQFVENSKNFEKCSERQLCFSLLEDVAGHHLKSTDGVYKSIHNRIMLLDLVEAMTKTLKTPENELFLSLICVVAKTLDEFKGTRSEHLSAVLKYSIALIKSNMDLKEFEKFKTNIKDKISEYAYEEIESVLKTFKMKYNKNLFQLSVENFVRNVLEKCTTPFLEREIMKLNGGGDYDLSEVSHANLNLSNNEISTNPPNEIETTKDVATTPTKSTAPNMTSAMRQTPLKQKLLSHLDGDEGVNVFWSSDEDDLPVRNLALTTIPKTNTGTTRSRKLWTEQEVDALINAVKKYGKNWSMIQQATRDVLNNRTNVNIKDKYRWLHNNEML